MGKAAWCIAAAVSVTIVLPASASAACSIQTAGVSFGTYTVFAGTPLDSTGSVTYNCNGGEQNIVISLSKGSAPTYDPRTLGNGSRNIDYNLFLNAARTLVWGDGTQGTQTHQDPAPPLNQNVTVTIHGRIPAGQSVPAGVYSDTIVATINF